MTHFFLPADAAAIILLAAVPLEAQPPAQSPDVARASRPVSAGLLGGVSAGSGDAGASAGALLTFDATDRVAVEARSVFLQRGSGTHGLELTGAALMSIAAGRRAAPYIAVGGGLYRSSFALGDDRLLGRMGSQFASGTQFVPVRGMGFGMMQGFSGSMWQGTWTGPTAVPAGMPQFYSMRLGTMMASSDGRLGMRSFTDPMVNAGVGVSTVGRTANTTLVSNIISDNGGPGVFAGQTPCALLPPGFALLVARGPLCKAGRGWPSRSARVSGRCTPVLWSPTPGTAFDWPPCHCSPRP